MPYKKSVRKYAFSLIEIAIGFTLAAFLLTALFNNYRFLMEANLKLQNVRNLIHDRSILVFRLNQVWNALENKENKKFFRTEAPANNLKSNQSELHFTYNNGVDREPNFCQEIEGTLYCNESKQLCLLSKGKNNDVRIEILWKKGEECTFSFFDSEKKAWVLEWEKPVLPPLIKIALGNEEFLFSLLKADHKVDFS